MNATRTAMLAAVLAFSATACGGAEDTDNTSGMDVQDTSGMAGMQGMEGMQGMQGGMMDDMTNHMKMMQGVSADSMKAMLPMHRQMAANMLARMNKDMRDMNMQTTPEWTATVDSVRDDLKVMPELRGNELQNLMNAHHRRMTRMMDMHRTMMSTMPM